MGLDEPDKEKVEFAAEISGVNEFIGQLPGGFDYILHEGARNISGGQRKSIALARAVIKKPKLLILDEPTTSLDGKAIERFLKIFQSISLTQLLLLQHIIIQI